MLRSVVCPWGVIVMVGVELCFDGFGIFQVESNFGLRGGAGGWKEKCMAVVFGDRRLCFL